MESLSRGRFIASLLGVGTALLGSKGTLAQDAVQTAGNGARIVATGNVHLGQNVSASQTVRGAGTIGGTGIQVVGNDGSITATGDVWVNQNAAADQDVTWHEGSAEGRSDGCYPGDVMADATNGQLYFCNLRACWEEVRCGRCR